MDYQISIVFAEMITTTTIKLVIIIVALARDKGIIEE
jgi:hypothetical protein